MEDPIEIIVRVEKLEARKRQVIKHAIDELLPHFAETDVDRARKFAKSTLDDILQGNHPEMASVLRGKVLALGVELDFDEEG